MSSFHYSFIHTTIPKTIDRLLIFFLFLSVFLSATAKAERTAAALASAERTARGGGLRADGTVGAEGVVGNLYLALGRRTARRTCPAKVIGAAVVIRFDIVAGRASGAALSFVVAVPTLASGGRCPETPTAEA